MADHGLTSWYRHDYTHAELQTWAQQATASGAKRVWAYFNNDREGFAIKNAQEFRAVMAQPEAPEVGDANKPGFRFQYPNWRPRLACFPETHPVSKRC